jgi:hypothetical protein
VKVEAGFAPDRALAPVNLAQARGYHLIGHLSWKRSWSFSTIVATVLSESSPLESFTTSER